MGKLWMQEGKKKELKKENTINKTYNVKCQPLKSIINISFRSGCLFVF
jgi:hypothetical protein